MDIKEMVKGARNLPGNTTVVTGDVVGGSLPPAPPQEPPAQQEEDGKQLDASLKDSTTS